MPTARRKLELVPDREGAACLSDAAGAGTPRIIMSPLSVAFEPHGSDIGCSRIDLYARRCTRPRGRGAAAGERRPPRLALEDAIKWYLLST